MVSLPQWLVSFPSWMILPWTVRRGRGRRDFSDKSGQRENGRVRRRQNAEIVTRRRNGESEYCFRKSKRRSRNASLRKYAFLWCFNACFSLAEPRPGISYSGWQVGITRIARIHNRGQRRAAAAAAADAVFLVFFIKIVTASREIRYSIAAFHLTGREAFPAEVLSINACLLYSRDGRKSCCVAGRTIDAVTEQGWNGASDKGWAWSHEKIGFSFWTLNW